MNLGRVAELWRYPVNGLQGESLRESSLLAAGLSGDHIYAIREVASGRVLDPKSSSSSWGEALGRPGMLELSASLRGPPDGEHELVVDRAGRTVCSSRDPLMNARISGALGGELELVRYPRFAESRVRSGRALHLITTASLAKMREFHPSGDFQVRRFRPNILVSTDPGVDGFAEDGWVGRDLRIGRLRVRVSKPNVRCRVTTMRQPGMGEDPGILEAIERNHGGNLGVMCDAPEEGVLRVGDAVSLA